MNARVLKVILLWNAALTVLLLASLLTNAVLVQAANDPPVKVFTASLDHASSANWAGTTANTAITSTATWAQILTLNVNLSGQTHNHQCAVISSLEVINPTAAPGSHHTYEFGVSLNNTSATGYSATNRTIDFPDTPDWDSERAEVSTARLFPNLVPGNYTIRLLGRKVFASTGDTNVDDASIVVFCFKTLQVVQTSPIFEEPENYREPSQDQ